MKRELTRRHSLLFEKKRAKNLLGLIDDVHRYQKWSELLSFAVWEVFHKIGLFPRKQYLTFASGEPLRLETVRFQEGLDEKIARIFRSRDLCAVRSPQDWKLLFTSKTGDILGSLCADEKSLYRSSDRGETVQFVHRFPERIKSIFVSRQKVIFVCVKGSLYRSCDAGVSFQKVLQLGSPESFFRHNNAMTETPDGTLLVGEYGNVWEARGWRKLAYVYFSFDGGESWQRSDFLLTKGINKHVHLVKYSQLLDKILVADGDNQKKLWTIDPSRSPVFLGADAWQPANNFHIQMGGYTAVVESEGKLLFGTDYQGGTNFLVETEDGKQFRKQVIPDPYRRSPIDNMVVRRGKHGEEIWANLPYSTSKTRCLLMVSKDGGESWDRLIEYNRVAHKVWLVSASQDIAEAVYLSIEDTANNKRAVYQVSGEL